MLVQRFEPQGRHFTNLQISIIVIIWRIWKDRMKSKKECLLFYLKDMKGQNEVKEGMSTLLFEGYERTEWSQRRNERTECSEGGNVYSSIWRIWKKRMQWREECILFYLKDMKGHNENQRRNVYSSIRRIWKERMHWREEYLLFYLKDMNGQNAAKGGMYTLPFEGYERTEHSFVYNVYSSIERIWKDRMQWREECLLFYSKDMNGQNAVKGGMSTPLSQGYEWTECSEGRNDYSSIGRIWMDRMQLREDRLPFSLKDMNRQTTVRGRTLLFYLKDMIFCFVDTVDKCSVCFVFPLLSVSTSFGEHFCRWVLLLVSAFLLFLSAQLSSNLTNFTCAREVV